MAIKLDMEMAYDRMQWNFLEYILREYGFHQYWISRIMACILWPSFAILVKALPWISFIQGSTFDKIVPSHHIFLFYVLTLFREL